MKNLNVYGEEFIKKVKEEGKLEGINDYYQVDSITVTQSQTNYLINMNVLVHVEECYIYANEKYKLDVYSEIECNEIFTIHFSSYDKKELIENFVEDMFADIFKYTIKEITEIEYNRSGDMTKEEVRSKLEDSIISR